MFEYEIYINKKNIDISFDDKSNIEEYLKKLFKKLKDYYYIKFEGFYNVNIYIDKYYGIVLDIIKEDIDYYTYFNQVDMKISKIDVDFIYKIDDIPLYILSKVKIFSKGNDLYLKIEEELNDKEMMYLMENSFLVYNY